MLECQILGAGIAGAAAGTAGRHSSIRKTKVDSKMLPKWNARARGPPLLIVQRDNDLTVGSIESILTD